MEEMLPLIYWEALALELLSLGSDIYFGENNRRKDSSNIIYLKPMDHHTIDLEEGISN